MRLATRLFGLLVLVVASVPVCLLLLRLERQPVAVSPVPASLPQVPTLAPPPAKQQGRLRGDSTATFTTNTTIAPTPTPTPTPLLQWLSTTSLNATSAGPPLKFVNIIDTALPHQTSNVRRLKGWQAAMFHDFNKDGLMDLLLTNHYGQCSMRARKQALKLNNKHPAANRSYCAEPFGWTWALREPTRLQYTPIQPGPAHFRLEDELELETNSSKMTQRGHQIDVHAFFVGHMDRDGREDAYFSTTTVKVLSPSDSANAVFWGVGDALAPPPADTGISRGASTPTPAWTFAGGRQAAMGAGLDYTIGEARGLLVFDADNDGVVDFLICAKPKLGVDTEITSSELLLSGGRDRLWRPWVNGISEYTSTALLTDLDGDGHAREVVMWRMQVEYCVPANRKAKGLVEESELWQWWCQSRPPASLGMYKIRADGKPLRLDDSKDPRWSGWQVEEWYSADLDGDGVADLIQLTTHELIVYPSTLRHNMELPHPEKNAVTICDWGASSTPGRAHSMAVADFDMDGTTDIFVLFMEPSMNRLFVQRPSLATWGPALSGHNDDNVLGFKHVSAAAVGLGGAFPANAKKATSRLELAWKGVSVADVDNDGFPDLFLAADGPDALMRNTFGDALRTAGQALPNHVAFVLVGVSVNRDAIGATVVLHRKPQAADGSEQGSPSGPPPQLHEVRRSRRTHGFDDERIVFGLGRGGSWDRVEVMWPHGERQVVTRPSLKASKAATVNNIANPIVVVQEV